jgi:hypothetical protein
VNELEAIAAAGPDVHVAKVVVRAVPADHPFRGRYSDLDMYEISVERVAPGRWAVRRRSQCWDGRAWVHEPIPSSRTARFKEKTRWPLDAALAKAKMLAQRELADLEARIAARSNR